MSVSPKQLGALVSLIGNDKINLSIAKRVLTEMWQSDKMPETIIEANDLWPIVDVEKLTALGKEIIEKMPQIKVDYLSGKTQALGAFMGQMMKVSQGKADPSKTEAVFLELVKS